MPRKQAKDTPHVEKVLIKSQGPTRGRGRPHKFFQQPKNIVVKPKLLNNLSRKPVDLEEIIREERESIYKKDVLLINSGTQRRGRKEVSLKDYRKKYDEKRQNLERQR